MLTAIKIPESFHGNSIILIPAGKQKCVSVECLREKTIELKTDNYNQDHCVTRCIKDGKISFGNEQELSVFLNRVKIATYGFFKVNNSKLYLLAIANPNIEYHANNGRIELFQLTPLKFTCKLLFNYFIFCQLHDILYLQ